MTQPGNAMQPPGIRHLPADVLQSIDGTFIAAQMKHGWAKSLGNPIMPLSEKLAALGEEFGEVCGAFTYDKPDDAYNSHRTTELLQLSALAAAWAACLMEEAREMRDAERTSDSWAVAESKQSGRVAEEGDHAP